MKSIQYGIIALLLSVVFLTSCHKTSVTSLSYGDTVKLGNGTARTFIKLDDADKPLEVGVAISEAAMGSLPHGGADLVLNFPAEGLKTQYKHVFLNYLHGGHTPVNVYTVDHFDVHFYNVPSSVRESIKDPNDARMLKLPATNLLPTHYFQEAAVPLMGMHWADSTAAEFRGKPFTSTFIYGSLDNNIIFHEPMVAVSFLKQKLHSHIPIRQPAKYGTSGYYPADYGIRYNEADKQYEVLLENFSAK